jgi:acetyl esterase/lipase
MERSNKIEERRLTGGISAGRMPALLLLLVATCFAPMSPAQSQPQVILNSVTTYKDLFYVPGSHNPKQALDLYIPKDHPPGKKLPLVIWVHGGGWSGGDKSENMWMQIAKGGFAAASINYRLTDEAQFPAQIFDVKAAVRWLRAHAAEYDIDPKRIGAWGASAGGHLVALLGTSDGTKELEGDEGNPKFSSRVQAVCDYFGPTDFVNVLDQRERNTGKAPAEPLVDKLLGGSPTERPEQARLASPVTFVTRHAPPFLIVHGDQDPLVPFQQSEELAETLKKHGVECSLIVVRGGGHGGFKGRPDLYPTVIDFFKNKLTAENK